MCNWKRICITNRILLTRSAEYTPKVKEQILKRLMQLAEGHTADAVILREKDLFPRQYQELASEAVVLCQEYNLPLILHHFSEASSAFSPTLPLHLSMSDFLSLNDRVGTKAFPMLGVSTHTVEEAVQAERLGASYITASHIFPTDCKPDLPPRGLDYLREVCRRVSIPVYALGGIHSAQIPLCMDAGAAGVCMMSEYFGKEWNEA